MEKKWNLQDIKPAAPRRKRVAMESKSDHEPRRTDSETESDSRQKRTATRKASKGKHSQLVFGLIAVFAVVGFGLIANFLMSGANITVYPKYREPNINSTFEAYKTPTVGELSYEIMTLEANGERQVTATGQEEVTEQATGEITIYKNTAGSERLIKNTRFETSDGLVYRITESAVVPGAKGDGEGKLVSGSIKAKVFADAPGDQFNLNAGSTFKVPGFKEGGFDDLYNAIEAKNENAISGGFDGLRFIIDEDELDVAKKALHDELKTALLDRMPTEKPSGFTMFEPAITFTYESLPAIENGDNMATIRERVNLQVPMFKNEDFASYIAKSSIPGYEDRSVRIDNLSDINFSYTSEISDETDISSLDLISFKLLGKPKIVWTFDETALKTDLMGSQKSELKSILAAYPAIEKAEAKVKPFWKRTFPNKFDDIDIIESFESN